MHKKIKDLTLEEVNKICTRNTYCESCPLWIDNNCARNNYADFSEEEVNKEIEVEEDKPQKCKDLRGSC